MASKETKLYLKNIKKEFREQKKNGGEKNWDNWYNEKNRLINEERMKNFKETHNDDTHRFYECICGTVLRKKRCRSTQGLKQHLESKKHLELVKTIDPQ
jgi:hypothetical protein